MDAVTWRELCRLEDISAGESKGFGPTQEGFAGVFAVRHGEAVVVYVNSCPHIGASLDWTPDRFLTRDGSRIICSVHGAEFDIVTGICTVGPCVGDRLQAVMIQIKDGTILIPEDAGF